MLLSAGIVAGAVVGDSPASARSGCAARRQIVRQTREVQVYTRQVRDLYGSQHADIFACSVRTRRSLAFADPRIPQIEAPRATVRVAGRFAAAFVIEGTGYDVRYSVRVIDLSPRRPRMVFDHYSTPTARTGAVVTDLVLSDRGALAWITRTDPALTSSPLEVRASGAHGSERLLDAGRLIRPGSLRLRGRQLSWHDGASTRTGSL